MQDYLYEKAGEGERGYLGLFRPSNIERIGVEGASWGVAPADLRRKNSLSRKLLFVYERADQLRDLKSNFARLRRSLHQRHRCCAIVTAPGKIHF